MTYQAEYERLVARTYDDAYAVIRDPSGDAAFYRFMAETQGGPLLELGCGTGRVLLEVAKTGIECVGLDASREMLRVLREKKPPDTVAVVHAHMESFDLGEGRFRLITAPFRAVQHLLDVPSQLAALNNVRRHLARGGAFAFDVFDPDLARTAVAHEPESLEATFRHQAHEVRRYTTVVRDASAQIMTVTFRFESDAPELVGSARFQMRWYYRYELEHLLDRAGFTDLTFYRDFARTPWSHGRETVVVARP